MKVSIKSIATILNKYRFVLVLLLVANMIIHVSIYLMAYGLHFGDAHCRWQECAATLLGINPFEAMATQSYLPDGIGVLWSGGGTVPWALILGNLINPGFLPYQVCKLYLIFLFIFLSFFVFFRVYHFLLKNGYVTSRKDAFFASLLIYAPCIWANSFGFGNQSGIISLLIILVITILGSHPILSGFILAVCMCKPQITFVFFLPLLFKGRWKTIFTSVFVVLGSWLAAAFLTHTSPFVLVEEILNQGLSYSTSYYGAFDFLLRLKQPFTTSQVLLCDILLGMVILCGSSVYLMRYGMAEDWLAWFSIAAIVSSLWFYKQPHDYLVLIIPAIYIYCKTRSPFFSWCILPVYFAFLTSKIVNILQRIIFLFSDFNLLFWKDLIDTIIIALSILVILKANKNCCEHLKQNKI